MSCKLNDGLPVWMTCKEVVLQTNSQFDQVLAYTAREHIQELLIGRAWGEYQNGRRMLSLRD